ncbi:hypothetical protein JNL27_18115, partial [bacterium]|nr:hypothetical protein [bacterium]
HLQGLTGNVVKVTQRNWNEKSAILELDILFKGSSESFAESMDGQTTTSGLKITVTGMTSGTVKLSVK